MAKRFFTIKGDNNSNIIPGTNFDDIIYGYGGNDILGAINSNGGDRIYGGDGDDVLYDNTGLGVISPILSDVLDGGKGNDDIFIAGGFLDRFDGGPGDDTFHILPGLLNLFATIDGGGGQDVVVFDIPMPPIQTGAIRHNGANWFFNFDGLFDFHVFRVEEVRFTDYTLDLDGVWAHPIAIDDHFDAQANQPLVIHIDTVLANDIDPDGDGTSFLDFASLNVIDNHDGTLTFDPDGMFDPLPAGETSDVSFEYRITDDRGLLSTGNIRITIHGVNDAPDAQNDLGTTTQNDPVTVAVLGNDTDPDTGDFLTVTDAWLSPDALSTVSFDNTTVTYNPASAYDNLDQGVAEQVELMYTVSDSGGKTDTAAVLITVIGINDQPDAQDDNFLTTQNAPITGNVFEANGSPADFDPDDPLQLTHVNNNPAQVNQWITLSRGGELKIRGDGVLDFNPLSAYVSLARFETVTETATYTITDDNGESDMATVMITVAGLNDQPVARTDTYMLNENATATLLDILANDDDPDLSDALHISTVDTTNTLGKVDWSGNQLTYDPNGQFDYLPVGVTATDRFDYIIADGNGGFNQASVEITITGENDPPRAIPDIGFTDEDTAVTVDVVDNDLDPDGDFLTVTGAQILSGSGTVTHDLANITFTPGAVYNALPAGAHEPVVVAYAVSDGFGGTTTGFVNIDVEGMNDQPIAVPDTGFTTENSAVTLPVIANDSDPDNGDTLRITDARIVSGNGNISYSTEDLLYDPLDNYNHLGTGEKTSIVLAYLVSDNHNAETSTFVTLEITGLNDAPEAFDGIVSLEEDQIIDFDMRDFVHDIDSDNLEIILDTLPAHGVLTLDGLTAIYTPDPDYNGDDHFSYFVSDGDLISNIAVLDLNLLPMPDAPVAVGDSFTIYEDVSAILDPLANDSDIDGDTLTIRITDQPIHGALSAIGGTVTYTPDPDYHGNDSFSYEAWDGVLSSEAVVVELTVMPDNDPPIALDDMFTVTEDGSTQINPLGNDFDLDGDPLTIQIVTHPLHGTLSEVDTTITYTPDPDYFGPDSFTYTAWDGLLASPAATVALTVNSIPDAPTANNDVFDVLVYAGLFGTNVFADNGHGFDTDPDSTFEVTQVNGKASNVGIPVTLPGGAVVRIDADGSFQADVSSGYENLSCDEFLEETLTYTISDADGLSSTATVTLIIEGNPPLIANEDFTQTTEGTPVMIYVTENEGWCRSFSVGSIQQPVNGTVSRLTDLPNTGGYNILVFDPEDLFDYLEPGEYEWVNFGYTLDPGDHGTSNDQLSAPVHVQVWGVA